MCVGRGNPHRGSSHIGFHGSPTNTNNISVSPDLFYFSSPLVMCVCGGNVDFLNLTSRL